jgi:RAD50-interacting protein 1
MQQYQDIIEAPDAWQIADDGGDMDDETHASLRPTNSARRIKALIDQVSG